MMSEEQIKAKKQCEDFMLYLYKKYYHEIEREMNKRNQK